jgi:mRNA interferase RelE/StbE
MKALTYTRTAIKVSRKMPKKDSAAIQAKLVDYAAGGKQDVKALPGSDMLRLRHGNWRAVFTEDGLVVAVLDVARRGGVYR